MSVYFCGGSCIEDVTTHLMYHLSLHPTLFRDNFDDDTLEITRATCADDIEDWDSLEQINLLTAIEKKFNIKFKLSDVRGLKDVGDLLDLVARMV